MPLFRFNLRITEKVPKRLLVGLITAVSLSNTKNQLTTANITQDVYHDVT